MLMGGGGSFSAGGPGKGMHSRLCKFYLYLLLLYSWFWPMFDLPLPLYICIYKLFPFEKSLLLSWLYEVNFTIFCSYISISSLMLYLELICNGIQFFVSWMNINRFILFLHSTVSSTIQGYLAYMQAQ